MERLRPQLGAIVAGMERGAPYAAALLSQRGGLGIRVDSREEQVEELPRTAGTVLTAFDGATLHEAAIGGFDVAAVEGGAEALVARLSTRHGPTIDPGPERRGDFVTAMEIPPDSLSTQEKLDRCREMQRRLAALDPRIVNAAVSYQEATELSVFANRTADLAQRVQRIRLNIFAVLAGESGVRYNYQLHGGTGGWELLDISDEDMAHCVATAVELLTAERIEPGEYTVIASPWVTRHDRPRVVRPRRRDRHVPQGARRSRRSTSTRSWAPRS